MLLPNIFMQAFMDAQGSLEPICELSAVKIQCPKSEPQAVKTYFLSEVETYWDEFWKNSVGYDEDEDEDEELKSLNELPVECSVDGNVVNVGINGMASRDENEMDAEYDPTFLEKALKSTKKKFSDIECSGFVITDFTNESYGEIYCEEVSADGKLSSKPTKKVYAELGEVLLAALSETGDGIDPGAWAFYGSSSAEIWDYIESELDDGDCESLFECFEVYSNWVKVEFFEKLLELSDDEDLTERIEEYIDELE